MKYDVEGRSGVSIQRVQHFAKNGALGALVFSLEESMLLLPLRL